MRARTGRTHSLIVRARFATAMVAVQLAAGCSSSLRAAPTSKTSTTSATTPARTVGSVPSPFPVAALACSAGHPNPVIVHGLFEVRGRATSATLWALVFADHPFVAGQQVKVAWHMTGAGPFHLSALDLDTGNVVLPLDGPASHVSSSWHRPGDEWGSAWVFPSQGCWRVTASRSIGTGSITVTVGRAPEH